MLYSRLTHGLKGGLDSFWFQLVKILNFTLVSKCDVLRNSSCAFTQRELNDARAEMSIAAEVEAEMDHLHTKLSATEDELSRARTELVDVKSEMDEVKSEVEEVWETSIHPPHTVKPAAAALSGHRPFRAYLHPSTSILVQRKKRKENVYLGQAPLTSIECTNE